MPFSRLSPKKLVHCLTLPVPQYCRHSPMYTQEQLHDAMNLLTLFTSGDTDISQIALELASWITHTYCIHAVGFCFSLGHTAEHQSHSERLTLADVGPQNCSKHDSQNGANSHLVVCSGLCANHSADIQQVSFQAPFVSLSSP